MPMFIRFFSETKCIKLTIRHNRGAEDLLTPWQKITQRLLELIHCRMHHLGSSEQLQLSAKRSVILKCIQLIQLTHATWVLVNLNCFAFSEARKCSALCKIFQI